MVSLLAACGGDDGGRHIVDGQGSGSATGFAGGVQLLVEDGGAASAYAGFYPANLTTPPPATCTTTIDGPCSVTTCTTTPPPSNVMYDDAGAITITGGMPTTVMALSKGTGNLYSYPLDDTGAVYSGSFTIAGTGAMVPAFTQTVTMPAAIEADAPANAATIPRSSDLTVTWTHGAQIDTLIYELYQPTPYAGLSCQVTNPGDAGSYTVPSSLMQMMAAGGATSLAFGYATTTAMVGEYATVFETGSIAQLSGGGDYNVHVILQ